MKISVQPPDDSPGYEVELEQNPFTIGRAPKCTLALPTDRKVSAYHARILVVNTHCQLIDLDSSNGTKIDGERIPSHEYVDIRPGQKIAIGLHVLSVMSGPMDAPVSVPESHQSSPISTWSDSLLRYLQQDQRRQFIAILVIGILLGYVFFTVLSLLPKSEVSGPPLSRNTPTQDPTDLVRKVPTWTPTPDTASAMGTANTDSFSKVTPLPAHTPTPEATNTLTAMVTTPRQPPPTQGILDVPGPASEPIVAAAAASSGFNWDPSLDQLGVTLEPAFVPPGQPYWRLIEAIWENEKIAGGRHHIYIEVLDEQGNRIVGQSVTVSWDGGNYSASIEDKPSPEYGYNFPMQAAGYAYNAKVEGLPSDAVKGMGLGGIEDRFWSVHVVYKLTFQRTIK